MSESDSDLAYVRRCAQGDEAALERLVAKHQPLVYGLAKRYLRSAEDAEEIVVSTFLKVWKSAESFRGDCSVKALICRIALNLCRDRPRPKPVSLPCPEPGVAPGFEGSQFERILTTMQHLSPDDREVLLLFYLDEMTYDEICDALGIGYDALKTRLTRARKRLRALLEIHEI